MLLDFERLYGNHAPLVLGFPFSLIFITLMELRKLKN